jgi:NADPH:quinone reductase
VIATADSPNKRAWVRELGADTVLHYRITDVPAEVLPLTDGGDVVLHLVGGDTFAGSLRPLRRLGRVVAMAIGRSWDGVRRIVGLDAADVGHGRTKASNR